MPSYSEPFGELVRQWLRGKNKEGRPLSGREVEKLTDGEVSRGTVQLMASGGIPSASDQIAILAISLGNNPNEALARAGRKLRHPGYPDVPQETEHRSPLFGAVRSREALAHSA